MTIDRAIEILDPDHREHYENLDEVNEACRMGMEALKRQRCIPVAERPPKEDEPVLFWSSHFGRWATGYFNRLTSDNAAWFDSDEGDAILSGTHWLPLPAPPEKGGNGNLVDAAPTVDAVPVVRCGECKYSRDLNTREKEIFVDVCLACENNDASQHGYMIVFPDHFCSYGERRKLDEEK